MRLVLTAAFASCLLACASTPKNQGPYPPRKEGCDVTVYPDAPTVPTDNIGTVNASCGDDIADSDCLRTLQDEACKLGADVVWGVPEKPTMSLGKKKLSGRAAHTKAAAPPAPAN